jgi:hypothetical protein
MDYLRSALKTVRKLKAPRPAKKMKRRSLTNQYPSARLGRATVT